MQARLHQSPALLKRFLRHLLAGALGTASYMLLVTILVEAASLHPATSACLAFFIVLAYTYFVNRLWVYRAGNGHGYTLPRFLAVTAVGFTLNAGLMFFVVEVLTLWYPWGLVATAVVVPPTNFILNNYWAFR